MTTCECELSELPNVSSCMIEKFYPIDIKKQIDSGLVVKIGLKAGEYPKLCHELIKAKIEALIMAGELTKETIPKTILFHFTNDY